MSGGERGERPLRLLALVQKRLDLSPGQRYRLEQWAPLLRRDHGIELDFAVFESDELTAVIYQPGRRLQKAGLLLRDLARRSEIFRRVRDYDGVVVYREAALLGPAIYERVLALAGIPMILDFDDAIWLSQSMDGPNGVFAKLRFPGKTATIAKLATAVTVGNQYLAQWAKQHAGDVTVVPTTVDLSRYAVTPPLPHEDPFVIVWSGSHSTLSQMETARGAIERFGKSRRVKVRIICDKPHVPFANVENEFVRWTSANEASDVAAAHVGIMPIPDVPFTRGKCALKGLLYMACGRPAVLSPVGVNRDIVTSWQNGVLAGTDDEWFAALTRLAEDRELQLRLGEAGRRTVEDGYSSARGADLFAGVVRRAVDRSRR